MGEGVIWRALRFQLKPVPVREEYEMRGNVNLARGGGVYQFIG